MVLLVVCSVTAQTRNNVTKKKNTNSEMSQKPYAFRYTYKNEHLTLTFKNGSDVLKDIQFVLSKKTYDEIKGTSMFKKWSHQQDSLKSTGVDVEYYKYREGQDKVVWFIDSKIRLIVEIMVKYELKEPYSYDFISESENVIYVKDNEVKLAYTYKAQTPNGTYKIDKKYITISEVDGEVKATFF